MTTGSPRWTPRSARWRAGASRSSYSACPWAAASRCGWPDPRRRGARPGPGQPVAGPGHQAVPARPGTQARDQVAAGHRERHLQARRTRARLRPGAGPGRGHAAEAVERDGQEPEPGHPAGTRLPEHRRSRRRPGQHARAAGRAAPDQVTVRECTDSYHVATLDNDAEAIFEGSVTFIQAVTTGNITLT